MVRELLEKETLDEHDLERLFANVRMSPERTEWLSDPNRPLPNIPPVPIPETLRSTVAGGNND